MGMSAPPGAGRRKAMSEINVTPLVDVMLVLLIIFMVSTPLIVRDDQERLVDINLPITRNNPDTVDLNSNDRLILRVGTDLKVYLGTELITDCGAARATTDAGEFARLAQPCFEELGLKLGNNPRLQADEALYLAADAFVPHGFVAGATNRLRLSGVTRVGMVTYESQPASVTPPPP
jgi:biopolymer transport protein TolR